MSSAPEGHKHVFFNGGLHATSILGVLERRSGRVSCTGWERMASTARWGGGLRNRSGVFRQIPFQPARAIPPELSSAWETQNDTRVSYSRLMIRVIPSTPPQDGQQVLEILLREGVVWGDAALWLPRLPSSSVDLFFMSPPYADARSYARIAPEKYVAWFLPFGEAMLEAARDTGSFVLNIKNRVANSGRLQGQRHPYVYELVVALQTMGWRWTETYIWQKPNAIPGRFGPRTKDAFEYVYHFTKGSRPYFDLNAVRVPYKADRAEIARRLKDTNGRRNTAAGFGRDRAQTYGHGGADPGNVITVGQTYNQHRGPAGLHTAVMPEGLAEFFVKATSPPGGVVIDPFAGSGTTVVVARRHGRQSGGIELHSEFVAVAQARIRKDQSTEEQGLLFAAQ